MHNDSGSSELHSKLTMMQMYQHEPLEQQRTQLTGLEPATDYEIRVAIASSKGVGPYSPTFYAKTLEGGTTR